MVIVTAAGQAVLDNVAISWTTGQYGSGTITETESDSSLNSALSYTSGSLTNTRTGLSLSMVHEIASTTANSVTLAEFATFQSATLLRTRVVTTPFTKTSSEEVVTTTILYLDIN
jgi:hypothetical protein